MDCVPTCILPQFCSVKINTGQLLLYPSIKKTNKADGFEVVFPYMFSPFQLI
ncbi:hypothetical protein Hanom_Chr09g00868481 [Helianthus anomalus]